MWSRSFTSMLPWSIGGGKRIKLSRLYTVEASKKTSTKQTKFILEYQKIFRDNAPVKKLVPLSTLGYDNYIPNLRPQDDIVDCIVDYIYNKSGILTPKYNALYTGSLSVLLSRLNLVMKESDISTGHFTLEESNSIIQSWNDITKIVGLTEEQKLECIEKLESIHGRSNLRYKKHLLGIYLGRSINRHGIFSYEIWRRICSKRRMSRFSKEEEELILRRVNELGKSSQTFQVISKELGRFYTVSVRNRYNQLTQKNPIYRRGPFSTAEDELILKEIQENGETAKAFSELAIKLNRRHGRNIKYRYYKLKYNNVSEPKKEFTPLEQEELMRIIFKAFPNTELRYIKPTDAFFTHLYEKFKRDSSILEKHWLKIILPILLSHELGILNQNWQVPLLKTLLEWTKDSKISKARDIDYIELLKMYPGQTKQSVQYFITVLTRNILNKLDKKDPTFQEILEEAVRINFFAKSPRAATIDRSALIVEIYKKIKQNN